MEIQTPEWNFAHASPPVQARFWCRFDPRPHPQSWPGGPEPLKAEEHIFENFLQNKRCSTGCKSIRAVPGTSASYRIDIDILKSIIRNFTLQSRLDHRYVVLGTLRLEIQVLMLLREKTRIWKFLIKNRLNCFAKGTKPENTCRWSKNVRSYKITHNAFEK